MSTGLLTFAQAADTLLAHYAQGNRNIMLNWREQRGFPHWEAQHEYKIDAFASSWQKKLLTISSVDRNLCSFIDFWSVDFKRTMLIQVEILKWEVKKKKWSHICMPPHAKPLPVTTPWQSAPSLPVALRKGQWQKWPSRPLPSETEATGTLFFFFLHITVSQWLFGRLQIPPLSSTALSIVRDATLTKDGWLQLCNYSLSNCMPAQT